MRALGRRDRFLLLFTMCAFVFIATLNIVALARIGENTEQIEELTLANRQVLAVQVPTLRARIAERDRTIASLESVNDQAIEWILKLTRQIEQLGGRPPRIVLKPLPQKEAP